MTRVLVGRHSKFAENFILTKGQGGFKPVSGCTDQVLVLRDVCDIMRSKGDRHFWHFWMQERHMILCGEKDCRWRWDSGRICQCMQTLVWRSWGNVLMDGECSWWFELEAWLRQGCPLSTVLYSVYVMEMLKDLEEKRLGIEVEGTWCGGLLCGWYFVLARDQVKLQVMLDVMGKYVMKWRFRFNSEKSKTMMAVEKVVEESGRLMRRELGMWKYSSFLECDLIEGWEEMYICRRWGKKLRNEGQELAVWAD